MKKFAILLSSLFFLRCDTTDDESNINPLLSPNDFQLVSMEAQSMDPYTGELRPYRLNFVYEGDKISKITGSEGEFVELKYNNEGRLISTTACEEDGCDGIWIYEYDADKLVKRTYKREHVEVNYTKFEYPSADTILAVSHDQHYGSPKVIKGAFKNGNLIKIFELRNSEWIETDSLTYDLTLTYPSSFKSYKDFYWQEQPFTSKNLLTHGVGNFGDGKTEINLTYSFDEFGNIIQIKEAEGDVFNFIYKQLK